MIFPSRKLPDQVSAMSYQLHTTFSVMVFHGWFILFLLIILTLLPFLTSAQTHHDSIARLGIKSGNIRVKRSSDSLRYEMLKKRFESSGNFYRKLRSQADNHFIYRNLYPLLFRKPAPEYDINAEPQYETIQFQEENGKVIRSVKIVKVPVFGGTVFDTTWFSGNLLDRSLNRLHFNTSDAVVRKYLRIRRGDTFDAVKTADNERLIREASLFDDARFLVSENASGDSVDVVLVIKDLFPLGFDVKVKSTASASVRFYNRNILGFGHQASQTLGLKSNLRPGLYLDAGSYKIRNLFRSFTDFELFWNNNPDYRLTGFRVNKPFADPETRTAGGINIYQTTTTLLRGESPSYPYTYNVYDLWAGYSLVINRHRSPIGERSVLALTGRYYNIDFRSTPPLVVEMTRPMVTLTRYLAGLSLLRGGYYKTNMIRSFGRTEDIPTGKGLQLNFGYESSILNKRYYTGLKLISGIRFGSGDFVYGWIEGSGYFNRKAFSDGIAGLGSEYITRLYLAGNYRLRGFLSLSYKCGINRETGNTLSLSNDSFSPAFSNFSRSGNQRLGLKAETVLFSPYYLMGFRFAGFTSFELAVAGSGNNPSSLRKPLSALNLGVRIKNENLVFSTFQISFTWYGRPDDNGNRTWFGLSDVESNSYEPLRTGAPDIAIFE